MDRLTGVTNYIARVTLDRLAPILKPEDDRQSDVMDLYMLPDRVVIALHPLAIKPAGIKQITNSGFARTLSASLQGRRVETLPDGGLFLQVAYDVEKGLFPKVALDLDQQPQSRPTMIPLGLTNRPQWMQFEKFAPALVGGATEMGKSSFMHGIVMALLHGGWAHVYAWDGMIKSGVEFLRYVNHDNMHYIPDYGRLIGELMVIAAKRNTELKRSGARSNLEYNQGKPAREQMPTIAFFIDEADEIPREHIDNTIKIAKAGRFVGIRIVLGTQRPTSDVIPAMVTVNLTSRVSFYVPDHHSSMQILGESGAQRLPKLAGRFLIKHGGLTEMQAFHITPPPPAELSAEQIKALEIVQPDPDPEPEDDNEDFERRVIELHKAGESLNAIQRALFDGRTGGAFYNRVRAVLDASTTTTG